ncbi:hypothetical protein HPB50_022773 [Hyalomma asiaticum]|uniref:Uncharacterized protein n=1 Tax=Hyalomma asiaticum TaxID=266040 RepID=A0ACB7TPH4_HYAAI|nr:hypothetical protein HPB50_022773 [Hyalomma asiaticum]
MSGGPKHGIPASTLLTILKAKDAIILPTSSGNASKKKHKNTTPHEKLKEALFMAVSCSTSPQQEQEEASPSCWEEHRQRDEVAVDQNFDDFMNTDTDTTEVLDEKEIVQLVSSAQEESEDANDPDTVEAPVPTPGQVMDAVDLLRRFAGAHEGAEDALTALASYKNCIMRDYVYVFYRYVGRAVSPSTATGSKHTHKKESEKLLNDSFA